MEALGSWAFGSFMNLTPASGFSLANNLFNLGAPDIGAVLGPRLSANASIILPTSPLFENATLRWQEYEDPNISVVVEVATESDVQETVRLIYRLKTQTDLLRIKYANKNGIQFLAMTGGHGAINSLGSVNHGIEIWMRQMNSISIAEDGKTATIGGGVLSKEVTDALWAAGKQTVTGVCECTSLIGPMLGGGHGLLQGRYGLAADNLISARVVLANGTSVTASEASHLDLFWALRGAGHNFGIVTEFEYKIYDVRQNANWAYESLIFTGDKVEEVFEQVNLLRKNGSAVELIDFSFFAYLPTVDPNNPVIFFYLLYEGAASVPAQYSAPFHAIGPAVVQQEVVPYTELASLTGNGNDGAACGHGSSALRFPISIKTYTTQAVRTAYDKFTEVTTEFPALNSSFFLFEGYSVRGVQEVPDASTAFSNRDDKFLIAPVMVYAPNATLDPIAIQADKDIRNIIHEADESSELHAYVNYAHGDETLEEMYGYEDWRQEKLKELKKEYDPDGKFSFYAPIH